MDMKEKNIVLGSSSANTLACNSRCEMSERLKKVY